MTPFPIVKRYDYPQFQAITFPQGGRVYELPEGRVPSVTTILSTLPKDGLIRWRKRIGNAKADQITNEACRVGTAMHDALEGYVSNYLQGRPNIPPQTEEERLAYQLADNMRRYALLDLNEVWGIEEALYCQNLYAGRTDLIGIYDHKPAIIDYKSALKPKKPEWVENYKLQIAAYNFCHKYMFGEGMETGVILIAVRPPTIEPIQRFIMTRSDLDRYEDQWLAIVVKYYDDNHTLPGA